MIPLRTEMILRSLLSHRQTICKSLHDVEIPHYELKTGRPNPALDPVKPVVDGWLDKDEDRPPKRRHTAKRIHERLTTNKGQNSLVLNTRLALPSSQKRKTQ